MTLDALIIFLGALVIIEPQLGFPTSWDAVILFMLGVFIVGLGIAVRRRGLRQPVTVKNETQTPHVQ